MPTPCFLVAATNRYRRRLRRYCATADGVEACPKGHGYHEASTILDVVELDEHPVIETYETSRIDRSEPWPTHCAACGYEFTDASHCQRWFDQLYRAGDGREWVQRDLPPGAMFHADWRVGLDRMQDGMCPAVVLPDGEVWFIGSEPVNGGRWTWSGIAPKLTVRPSIRTPRYHGWLTDGVLSDDIDRRPAR